MSTKRHLTTWIWVYDLSIYIFILQSESLLVVRFYLYCVDDNERRGRLSRYACMRNYMPTFRLSRLSYCEEGHMLNLFINK